MTGAASAQSSIARQGNAMILPFAMVDFPID
jgi:hypothetical protein